MSLTSKAVSRREFLAHSTQVAAGIAAASALNSSFTRAEEKVFRVGIIGLDTSHVPAFTKVINDSQKNTVPVHGVFHH